MKNILYMSLKFAPSKFKSALVQVMELCAKQATSHNWTNVENIDYY